MCSCSIRILHLTHPINFKPLILSCYLPGEKLRELLHEEGSMEMVNLRIEREHLQESQEDLQGGWHTEGSLKLIPGWDVYLDWILSKYRLIDPQLFFFRILSYIILWGLWWGMLLNGPKRMAVVVWTLYMVLKSTGCQPLKLFPTKKSIGLAQLPLPKLNFRTISCSFVSLVPFTWSLLCEGRVLCRMLWGFWRTNLWR